ncbi:MAG: hypothetical protein GH144_04505 [Clostridia bacterium]|jgi:hypothetical protein|nr:hypothetical protein [Clostridia bacterium]
MPKEKNILSNERKQIRAFLAAIRTENNAVANRLASIIAIVKSTRASQLGIDVMITDLEENMK